VCVRKREREEYVCECDRDRERMFLCVIERGDIYI